MTSALVRNDDIAWEDYPAENGTLRLKRLVSRQGQGSELGIGLCEIPPGGATVWWSFLADDDTEPDEMWFGDGCHETYYILSGKVDMTTRDGEGNDSRVEAGVGDTLYMAPGHRYQVRNIGEQPALFLFAMTPSAA